jgi:hypothetical protein
MPPEMPSPTPEPQELTPQQQDNLKAQLKRFEEMHRLAAGKVESATHQAQKFDGLIANLGTMEGEDPLPRYKKSIEREYELMGEAKQRLDQVRKCGQMEAKISALIDGAKEAELTEPGTGDVTERTSYRLQTEAVELIDKLEAMEKEYPSNMFRDYSTVEGLEGKIAQIEKDITTLRTNLEATSRHTTVLKEQRQNSVNTAFYGKQDIDDAKAQIAKIREQLGGPTE